MFNVPEFTVSEFSSSIKRVVEDAFGYVRIKGEISGFKKASSGHLYFSLKDENALISAVCFRGFASGIDFEVGDGLEVVASGKITTYEGRSNYQIIVEKLEIAGIGAILEMLEKRKIKLQAEGLFDENLKKPIPFFPKKIGVITSKTGAVIEDIKHRIQDRCPTHLLFYPTAVQGQNAAKEIIQAIKFFNNLAQDKKPEVIIIARGGGSFEDLLPFYDEALIREVFKCDIPIISAVGHETDTTLIDFVADLRAPTPTAAAEFATPVLADLKGNISYLDERLKNLVESKIEENFSKIKTFQKYLKNPKEILQDLEEKFLNNSKRLDLYLQNHFEKKSNQILQNQISTHLLFSQINLANQKISYLSNQLNSNFKNEISNQNIRLENLFKLLKSNNYQEILNRGFALIKNQKGQLITSKSAAKIDEKIEIEMSDGKLKARILDPNLRDLFE